MVARLCNHCCHGNTTAHSLCIFINLHAAVSNIKLFSIAMEIQQWVPFALLWSYELFHTAVNHINLLRYSDKVPDIFACF
jgi:hypothetical protein